MKSVKQKRKIFSVMKELEIRVFLFVTFSFIIPDPISAQPDTVRVPSDLPTGEGNLNYAVKVVKEAGKLSSTIFFLEPNGYYVLSDSILVPAGEHLTIVAPESGQRQETAPPQILCSPKYDGWTFRINYLFVCEGDLTLKNIWLLHATTIGQQIQACTVFRDDPKKVQVHKCVFDGVIIDYSCVSTLGGGSVTVACKNFNGSFNNCYWKNNTDPHFRYYGRAVSFPFASTGYHIDSLSFENCTFANIGYVLMQEGGEYSDHVKFNHCTFLNVVMYSLESGWWYNLSLTNSIFVNAHMHGCIPVLELYDGGEPYGATIRIDSISAFDFDVPFKENDRRILFANCSYYIEEWIRDWMRSNSESKRLIEYGRINEVPFPQPMMNLGTIAFFNATENGTKVFPYMNSSALYDSTDPGFILPPSDTGAIKGFLYHKWFDCCDTTWAWKPQNSIERLWPLEENLAYRNEVLLTAGMYGFPLGDLYHWYPGKYESWKAQKNFEDERISKWLSTGNDPGVVDVDRSQNSIIPSNYILYQNYPNPFNSTTVIGYLLPVAGKVTLKVYDMLGREVASLVDGMKPAGNYAVSFTGTGLASGVYLCQLKSNSFAETKKIVLLK